MEYQVLVATDEHELKLKVDDSLKDGWDLQGGASMAIVQPFMSFFGGGTMVCQAMTREVKRRGLNEVSATTTENI